MEPVGHAVGRPGRIAGLAGRGPEHKAYRWSGRAISGAGVHVAGDNRRRLTEAKGPSPLPWSIRPSQARFVGLVVDQAIAGRSLASRKCIGRGAAMGTSGCLGWVSLPASVRSGRGEGGEGAASSLRVKRALALAGGFSCGGT